MSPHHRSSPERRRHGVGRRRDCHQFRSTAGPGASGGGESVRQSECPEVRRAADRAAMRAGRPAAGRASPKIQRARCKRARTLPLSGARAACRCARRPSALPHVRRRSPPLAPCPRGLSPKAGAGDRHAARRRRRDERGTGALAWTTAEVAAASRTEQTEARA
jgi:hypothetical protein